MNAKEITSYVGGVIAFVIVAMLLRKYLPIEVALGVGWLAMWLVGYPFARYISGKRLTFSKWAAFSTLGAIAGMIVFHYV